MGLDYEFCFYCELELQGHTLAGRSQAGTPPHLLKTDFYVF